MSRRRIYSILCTLMIVAISCYSMSFAAEKKKGTSTKQEATKSERLPKEEKQSYATKSFDVRATSLSSDYVGHDIIALYKQLSKAFPPRDEFESTEAYRKRLDDTYPQDIFAFVVDNRRTGVNASYDPDMQIMDVKVNAKQASNHAGLRDRLSKMREAKKYDSLSNYETVIVTRHISGNTKEYEAGNKLGAKTTVTKYTGQEYGIGLINKDSFSKAEKYSIRWERRINFKISPEEGRELKTNLGILLVCKVKLGGDPAAYSFKSFYHAKPTMDSPTELSFLQFFVNVDLFEIWVFNRKTGAVYAKELIVPLPGEQEKTQNNEKM